MHPQIRTIMNLLGIAPTLLVLLLAAGCADRNIVTYGSGATVIRISGSTTMDRLVRRWAQEFCRLHPEVSIIVETAGSADGVASLIQGRSDMAAGSRPLLPAEARDMFNRRQSIGFAVRAAKDALSMYVHPSNPVTALTTAEVRAILAGRIGNWAELGGLDEPILVFARDHRSGTAGFIEEHVLLGEALSGDAILMDSDEHLVSAVAAHPNGIGFGGIASGAGLRHIDIDGVEPIMENVLNDSYPISRYLFLFTVRPPQGAEKAFVNFVLSQEGQRIALDNGYVPLYEFDPASP